MKQLSRWTLVGVVLVLVVAPIFLLAGGDAAAGKAVFDKKCATCHGPDGAGKDAMAKMLKVEFRALGSKEVQAKKDEELRKDITEGNGKMKPVKGLTDAEVVNRVIEDAEVERPLLVAHSMGGPVVLTALRGRDPESLSGLVVLASAAYWAKPRLRAILAMDQALLSQSLEDLGQQLHWNLILFRNMFCVGNKFVVMGGHIINGN